MSEDGRPERIVICIGDVHGRLRALKTLWSALQSAVGDDVFSHATVVFLVWWRREGLMCRDVTRASG